MRILWLAIVLWATAITQSWAAPSIVNHVVVSTASAASITTPTFSATSGNTLVIGFCMAGSVSSTLTTSTGNTPTGITTGVTTPAGNTPATYYVQNITGSGTYSVTLTPFSARAMSMEVVEIAGVLTSGVFDVSAANSNTPATTAPISGTTATTAQASEMAVSFICSDSAANPATFTDGGGWTNSDKQTNGAQIASAMSWQVLAATQTIAETWTTDSATSYGTVQTFKASAGGGGSSGGRIQMQRNSR